MSLSGFKNTSFQNDKMKEKVLKKKVLALKKGKLAVCSPRRADARSVPRHAGELSCHGIVNGFGTLGKGVSSLATEVAHDDFPAVRAQVALFPAPETPVLRAGAAHVGPGTTFKARLGLPLVPAVAPLRPPRRRPRADASLRPPPGAARLRTCTPRSRSQTCRSLSPARPARRSGA